SSLTCGRDLFTRAAALLTTEQDEGRRSDETAATDVVVQLNTNLSTELLCTPATLVTELKGETSPSHIHGGQMLVERGVQGVVFSIAPWNAPLLLTIRAVGHAIVYGNAVNVTTSEVRPRSQYVIAEPLHEVAVKTITR
ncbi:hypothetical protein DAEQUDRAFT_681062, partial [Daedalea quercina L-15889]